MKKISYVLLIIVFCGALWEDGYAFTIKEVLEIGTSANRDEVWLALIEEMEEPTEKSLLKIAEASNSWKVHDLVAAKLGITEMGKAAALDLGKKDIFHPGMAENNSLL
jgi:hypothetical protein